MTKNTSSYNRRRSSGSPPRHDGLRRPHPPQSVRVAVVDADPAVHRTLSAAWADSAPDWTVASYTTGTAALAGIPQSCPNIVLTDIALPDLSGFECIRRLTFLMPKVPILVQSEQTHAESVLPALMAGAAGYLKKPLLAQETADAIQQSMTGHAVLCPEAATALRQCLRGCGLRSRDRGLTVREQELLACLVTNRSDKELAEALRISDRTVHAHLASVYKKLGVHNRVEAIQYALGSDEASSLLVGNP